MTPYVTRLVSTARSHSPGCRRVHCYWRGSSCAASSSVWKPPTERREAIEREFHQVGLSHELWPAVDGHELTDDALQAVDQNARARVGLCRLDRSSLACLMSHLAVLRHLVKSDEDMLAVFEDDARLHPDLPKVLAALEGKAARFDVVKLQRRNMTRPYFPVYQPLLPYTLGRVQFDDFGSDGYVMTRHAAAHLLERFPVPIYEIDWIISRYWDNGLSGVLYVDPPVVFHDQILTSHIAQHRSDAEAEYQAYRRRNPSAMVRRVVGRIRRSVKKRRGFQALRRQDRDADPYEF